MSKQLGLLLWTSLRQFRNEDAFTGEKIVGNAETSCPE